MCVAVTVLDDCQQRPVHELTDTGGFAQHSKHSISLSPLGRSLHFVLSAEVLLVGGESEEV